jgi:hypothetical protein
MRQTAKSDIRQAREFVEIQPFDFKVAPALELPKHLPCRTTLLGKLKM